MEGCGSHRPFHHPDTETMATVAKVTRGVERQKAQGGWDAEGKPQGEEGTDKDRAGERAPSTGGGRQRARSEVDREAAGRRESRGKGPQNAGGGGKT